MVPADCVPTWHTTPLPAESLSEWTKSRAEICQPACSNMASIWSSKSSVSRLEPTTMKCTLECAGALESIALANLNASGLITRGETGRATRGSSTTQCFSNPLHFIDDYRLALNNTSCSPHYPIPLTCSVRFLG